MTHFSQRVPAGSWRDLRKETRGCLKNPGEDRPFLSYESSDPSLFFAPTSSGARVCRKRDLSEIRTGSPDARATKRLRRGADQKVVEWLSGRKPSSGDRHGLGWGEGEGGCTNCAGCKSQTPTYEGSSGVIKTADSHSPGNWVIGSARCERSV